MNNLNENTNVVNLDDFLNDNRMPYFYYTIKMRALPDWFDGLKPSHRRIIYSMYESNILYDKKRIKGKKADGLVGSYNPHGSLYGAIARLSRKDTCSIPLLDPKGNMGLHNSNKINESADRYTSFRLSEYSCEMFKYINKGIVEFKDNYDESAKEPVCLVTDIPNVLINPNIGVANGFATRICSYNIEDVCKQTQNAFLNKEIETIIPDFPTKGYIVKDLELFEKIMKYGKGSVKLRAKYHVDGNDIVVTELPYLTNIESVETKIIELIKNNKIKEIIDVNNYTDSEGLRLHITCKKNTDFKQLMVKLYKLTSLESTFSVNMTMLYNNRPELIGTRKLIKEWTNKRLELEIKLLNINKKKIEQSLQLLKMFKNIAENKNRVIEIISLSETEDECINNIKNEFELNTEQAKHINSIKLTSLNKNYIKKQIEKINNLELELSKINNLLLNENELRKVLSDRVSEFCNKYKTGRMCEVIEIQDKKSIDIQELLIEDYNVVCYLTKDGYFKKVKSIANKGLNKLKDDDYIIKTIECSNKDELLIFGSDLNVYKYKLYELEETKLSNLGSYLPSLIGCSVLGMSVISDKYKYVLITYCDGNIAKISLDSYKTKQNRSCLNKSLNNENVFEILTLDGDCNIEIKVSDGRTKTINTNELTLNKSRSSSGKKIMTWKNVSIDSVNILNEFIDNKLV